MFARAGGGELTWYCTATCLLTYQLQTLRYYSRSCSSDPNINAPVMTHDSCGSRSSHHCYEYTNSSKLGGRTHCQITCVARKHTTRPHRFKLDHISACPPCRYGGHLHAAGVGCRGAGCPLPARVLERVPVPLQTHAESTPSATRSPQRIPHSSVVSCSRRQIYPRVHPVVMGGASTQPALAAAEQGAPFTCAYSSGFQCPSKRAPNPLPPQHARRNARRSPVCVVLPVDSEAQRRISSMPKTRAALGICRTCPRPRPRRDGFWIRVRVRVPGGMVAGSAPASQEGKPCAQCRTWAWWM